MAFVKCHHGNVAVTCVACGLEQKEADQKKGMIEKIDVGIIGKMSSYSPASAAVVLAEKLNEIIDYLCEQQ